MEWAPAVAVCGTLSGTKRGNHMPQMAGSSGSRDSASISCSSAGERPHRHWRAWNVRRTWRSRGRCTAREGKRACRRALPSTAGTGVHCPAAPPSRSARPTRRACAEGGPASERRESNQGARSQPEHHQSHGSLPVFRAHVRDALHRSSTNVGLAANRPRLPSRTSPDATLSLFVCRTSLSFGSGRGLVTPSWNPNPKGPWAFVLRGPARVG